MKTSEDAAARRTASRRPAGWSPIRPAARVWTKCGTSSSACRCATTSAGSRASKSGCSRTRRTSRTRSRSAWTRSSSTSGTRRDRWPTASRRSVRSASRAPPKGCASCANRRARTKSAPPQLDEQLSRSQRDLREQILDQHRRLSDDIRQRVDEVLAALARETETLRADKTDRATLASLLTEMAMRLTDELRIPGAEDGGNG